MEDILLINTNQYSFERSFKNFRFYCFNFPFIKPVLPHIGLCLLASVLKEKGFQVKIIDGHLFYLENQQILNLIVKNNPKIVGITVTSPALPEIRSFIKNLREKQHSYPLLRDLKIVVGGPHVTAMPQSVFELGADIGCIGESEEILPLLCDYFINGKGNLSEIKGLVYIKGGQKIYGEPQVIEDLDSLPPPAFDLYMLPKGLRQKLLTIPLIQSRGCICNCIFCVYGYLAKGKIRFESISKVIQKMDFLIKRYKPKFIIFKDNLFTCDKERIRNLIAQIKQKNIKIDWGCETRIDFVDSELLEEMSLAGCRWISFGVESGVDRIRHSVGKNINNNHYLEIFNICRKNRIRTNVFFMVGFPSETKEDLKETAKFARKLKPDYLFIQITVLFPGTKLFYYSIENGGLDKQVWSKYMQGKIGLPFYIPEGLSLKELQAIRLKVYLKHYLNFKFIAQIIFKAKMRYWLKEYFRFKFISWFRNFVFWVL